MGTSQTVNVGSGGSSILPVILFIAVVISIAVAAVAISQPIKEQTKMEQAKTDAMKVAANATAVVIKALSDAETARIREETSAAKTLAQSEAMVAKAPIEAMTKRDIITVGLLLVTALVLMFAAAFLLFRHETHQAILEYRKTHSLPPTGTIELPTIRELPAIPERVKLERAKGRTVPAKRLQIGAAKDNSRIT